MQKNEQEKAKMRIDEPESETNEMIKNNKGMCHLTHPLEHFFHSFILCGPCCAQVSHP